MIFQGGVAVAISELCLANKKELKLNLKKNQLSPLKFLFGEDQSRYLVVINNKKNLKLWQNNIK